MQNWKNVNKSNVQTNQAQLSVTKSYRIIFNIHRNLEVNTGNQQISILLFLQSVISAVKVRRQAMSAVLRIYVGKCGVYDISGAPTIFKGYCVTDLLTESIDNNVGALRLRKVNKN